MILKKMAQFQNFGKHLTFWVQSITFQNRGMRLYEVVCMVYGGKYGQNVFIKTLTLVIQYYKC